MKNDKNKQLKDEVSRLRKGFDALEIDYKKGVLETAQGLLRIQRNYRKLTANDAGHAVCSGKCKDSSNQFSGFGETWKHGL